MIRVHTGSRLHFGVFCIGTPPLDAGRRSFGGAGLMTSEPGIRLAVEPARTWSAAGPLAERALRFARQFATSLPPEVLPPHHVVVESAAPEHVGLGTGTQLGLAIASALTAAANQHEDDVTLQARRVGRGRRSALGIHGFVRGGFLVEAGKHAESAIAPLAARADFPDDWRVVLVMPAAVQGLHGPDEIEAFRRLAGSGAPLGTDALCRLVLLGVLPALAEHDAAAFGDALYEFNRRVGEAFAAVQGGPYASRQVEEIVHWLRAEGIRGVAQSSWGPTLAAVAADADQARLLADRLRRRFGLAAAEVLVTSARNRGAEVIRES